MTDIIKLTQKQFIEKLPNSAFINCFHKTNYIELLNNIDRNKIDVIVKNLTTYTVLSVNKRSKDIQVKASTDKTVYRDFYGRNEYYLKGRCLLHQNTQTDKRTGEVYICTFLNITQ